jgi:MYXO-CTERM domain-containing protein
MRDLGSACEVCAEALIASFLRVVDPIDRSWPHSAISIAAADTLTASIALAPLSSSSIEWSIDGVPVPTSGTATLALDAARIGSGTHELAVRVVHETDRVRSYGRDLLTSQRRWTIEVGPDICGDSVVSGEEACDDGINDDRYAGCKPGCLARAPFCGDGFISDGERCDPSVSIDCTEQCEPIPEPEGCGCRTTHTKAGAPILLVLAALAVRMRRG